MNKIFIQVMEKLKEELQVHVESHGSKLCHNGSS